MLKNKNQIINIGSSKPIKVIDLAKMMSNKFVYVPKRPGEPDRSEANIVKAKKILKWSPKISFKYGVDELINNIAFWKDAPLWDKKSITLATKIWFKQLK